MSSVTTDGPNHNTYRGTSGGERYRGGSSSSRHHHQHHHHHYSRHRSREPSSGGRPRRLEDALEQDELLAPEQLVKYSSPESEETASDYSAYVHNHRRAALERFFQRHKNEAWLTERYGPFVGDAYWQRMREAAQERARMFMEDWEGGLLTGISLDDGTDLLVDATGEGEAGSTSNAVRPFPASMRLPDRVMPAVVGRQAGRIIIALGNISPMVTMAELETMVKECAGEKFVALEVAEPMVEKNNYRLGWLSVAEDAEVTAIVAAIEERALHGDKIYCSASRSFSRQIRLVDAAHSQPERLTKDCQTAWELVKKLNARDEINMVALEKALTGLEEKQQLDLLCVYLRRVFFVCFYNAVVASGPLDLARQAGDLVVRRIDEDAVAEPAISSSSQSSLYFEEFDRRVADLLDRLTYSYEPFKEDTILERHVAKVDEGRYRCTQCPKLFKGVDFVIKHLRLKHEDLAKTVILEAASLNSFMAHPSLSAILPLPSSIASGGSSRRSSSDRSHEGNSYRPRDYRYRERERDRDYRRGPYSGGKRSAPPPPPSDAVPDPRRIRQYVDWDAPATGDLEISYD